jgi:MFS family permease
MAVVLTFYAGEVSYAFFVLKGQASGLPDATVIALYLLFNVVFVLAAIPSGSISDRLGRKPVILFSFSAFAVTCATMAVADGLVLLTAGFLLFGLYKGTSEGVLKAYVVDVIPRDLRGTALGAFHTSVGLVMLPGGVVAGLLWDSVGPWGTFAFGGTMALAAAAMLAAFGKGRAA